MNLVMRLLFLCLAAFAGMYAKPKLLWFDATANFGRLSSRDSIQYYLAKAAEVGFTDVVVDVKPITGEVLYPSRIAPQMKEWGGLRRSDSLSFLETCIDEAGKCGLRVHASLNVFAAGHNYHDRGIVYTTHPEWQSLLYTDSGIVPITTLKKKYSAMTNPANREVQLHELAILRELVTRYRLDGVILDRVRFDGIQADFSPLSRRLFEGHLGRKLDRFPEDIFAWEKTPDGGVRRAEGKYFRQWLQWRASLIYAFIREARDTVREANRAVAFGDYVGSWYPTYYEVGVNWGSSQYDPSKKYPWATQTYRRTGYADLLDFLTTGNYYFEVTKDEIVRKFAVAEAKEITGVCKDYWCSVEGACEIVNEVLLGAVKAYGGLYVEQYQGHPSQFAAAISMCLEKSDGLMVFDLVHIVQYCWWDVLKKAIKGKEQ